MKNKIRQLNCNHSFSLTKLMVVLVIIGVLVLLALPKLLPIVTKAKTTEAKLLLKQVYILEQSYKFEHELMLHGFEFSNNFFYLVPHSENQKGVIV